MIQRTCEAQFAVLLLPAASHCKVHNTTASPVPITRKNLRISCQLGWDVWFHLTAPEVIDFASLLVSTDSNHCTRCRCAKSLRERQYHRKDHKVQRCLLYYGLCDILQLHTPVFSRPCLWMQTLGSGCGTSVGPPHVYTLTQCTPRQHLQTDVASWGISNWFISFPSGLLRQSSENSEIYIWMALTILMDVAFNPSHGSETSLYTSWMPTASTHCAELWGTFRAQQQGVKVEVTWKSQTTCALRDTKQCLKQVTQRYPWVLSVCFVFHPLPVRYNTAQRYSLTYLSQYSVTMAIRNQLIINSSWHLRPLLSEYSFRFTRVFRVSLHVTRVFSSC